MCRPGRESTCLFAVTEDRGASAVLIDLETTWDKADAACQLASKGRGVGERRPKVRSVPVNFSGRTYRVVVVKPPVGFAPMHPLDLPAAVQFDGDAPDNVGDYLDRATAFEIAAEDNDREMQTTERPGAWCVVVQVGKPLPNRTFTRLEIGGGIGYEESTVYRPIRLIQPTEAEIAKYAIAEAVA